MSECKHNWKYKENKRFGSYYGICTKCKIQKESWEIASAEKLVNLKHQYIPGGVDLNKVTIDSIKQLKNAKMPITKLKITVVKKIDGKMYKVDIKVSPTA